MWRGWKALLFIAILSLFAADVSVGCGQGYVYGPVKQKYSTGGHMEDHLISVNGTAYDVPLGFFAKVQVGDTVKFDGKQWTIVKHPRSPDVSPVLAPSSPIPGSPAPSSP